MIELSKKIISSIFPFLAKNKTIQEITNEIGEAGNTSLSELWKWIKPIFIEEFDADTDIDDKKILEHEVKKKLKKTNELEITKLESILRELESSSNAINPKRNIIVNEGNKNISVQDSNKSNININNPRQE